MPHSLRPLLIALLALSVSACASDDTPEGRAVELMQEGVEAGRDGDLDSAAELLAQAADERPGFIDPLMFLANVEERRENPAAARAAYLRALQIDPTFTEAGVALALTYVQEQRYDRAGRWLRRCVDMDPGCDAALFNLGALAEHEGDTTAAIAWYRMAGVMNIWSNDPVLHEGRLQLAAGRLDEARRLAERAYTRDAEDPNVFEFVQAIRAAEK